MSGDAPGPGSDPPSTPTASIEELDALRKELDDAKKAAASAEKKLAVMRAMSEADSKKNGDAAVELDSLRERCAEAEANLDKACLLYTSPSPRDLSTSRMPSSA